MSIVRVGLSDKSFAAGYDAIFSKKKGGKGKQSATKAQANKGKKKGGKKK
jgi:hypothetical protein